MSNERITLILPSKPEYAGIIRLTAAAVGHKLNLSFEDIEDVKLAIGEMANLIMEHASNKELSVEFYVESGNLCISAKNKTTCPLEDEIPYQIIHALMDEFICDGESMVLKKKIG